MAKKIRSLVPSTMKLNKRRREFETKWADELSARNINAEMIEDYRMINVGHPLSRQKAQEELKDKLAR